jgi:LPS-assembly protein
MHERRKNIISIGILLVFTFFLTLTQVANGKVNRHFSISLTFDTIPTKKLDSFQRTKTDTLPKGLLDTPKKVQEIKTFEVKASKDSLDAPVDYYASDSAVVIVKEDKIYLYSKTNVKYKDFIVDAERIELDQKNNLLTAYALSDSLGRVTDRGRFAQGENKSQFDTLQFNTKTQKGLSKNTFTKQDEIFINAQNIKRVDSATTFGKNAILTTCNYDDPHFGFVTKRLKYVQDKVIVTGTIQPVFESVKLPIGLPFGIFPQKKGRHSGFLPPQFTVNEQFGLGLEGLGWYHVFNDYIDLTARANIYSYGSWNLFVTPVYRKRYRYNGGLNFSLQNTKLNFPGDPDFSKNLSFQLGWNHTVDQKVRPGVSFTANVNAGSSKYNQNLPNNPIRNFNNQLNSTINFTKTFGSQANLAVTMGHDQNANTGDFNLRLPSLDFTYNTVYPFAKKESVGDAKWYEKLGVGLISRAAGVTRFNDTITKPTPQNPKTGIVEQASRNYGWNVSHDIPITLSLPSLGPVQIAPSISYSEKWFGIKNQRTYNIIDKKVDSAINKGFYTSRQVSFGINANTQFIGLATFKAGRLNKNGKLNAIRYLMRPTLGFSYTPNMNAKEFYDIQIDRTGRRERFSIYQDNQGGFFNANQAGNINFGVDNNLEMKVKSKNDTLNGGYKKVAILDGFSFNGSYNLLADSFPLSNIGINARSNLLEKISITATASLNPYVLDERGYSTRKYAWQNNNGFSLGTLQSLSLSASTSFQGKEKKKKDDKDEDKDEPRQTLTLDELQAQQAYVRNNPSEFVDFNIPWKLDLSLSVSVNPVTRLIDSVYTRKNEITSGLTANGDVSITPKWKVGYNSSINIRDRKVEFFTMYLTREMHCWQLSVNITPVGPVRFFNITINPKSGILRDLRINRSRFFYN